MQMDGEKVIATVFGGAVGAASGAAMECQVQRPHLRQRRLSC